MKNSNCKVDAYEQITNKIIESLKNGVCPWQQPWNGGNARYISYSTGKEYSFLNSMLLSMCGKPAGEFITYAQCEKAGGHVKKGAKGCTVYFYKQSVYTVKAVDEDGKPLLDTDGNPMVDEDGNPLETVKTGLILKGYTVFALEDCEGIKPKHTNGDFTPSDAQPIETAQAIINNYYNSPNAPKLDICHSNRAYYAPSFDKVTVPELNQYENAAEFYSTLFHESVHSTGHASRLNRFKDGAKAAAFGSQEYSREELVAEIGAAYLVNQSGIDNEAAFNNSVAYLQGWINHLTQKKRDFAIACAQAEKAADYILNPTTEKA